VRLLKVLWIARVNIKYFLRRFTTGMPSFCKRCGINVRDFSVTDKLWGEVEPKIKKGHTLCYNCFCDLVNKTGWTLKETKDE
jgi:hypothetical protein